MSRRTVIKQLYGKCAIRQEGPTCGICGQPPFGPSRHNAPSLPHRNDSLIRVIRRIRG